MHAPNPVRSVRGFLQIKPFSSSMFTGLPCWSSHLPGQGILILTSIHQDATALSPLINSMESVLVPILGYVKTSFSVCTLIDMTTVHCSLWGCTSVLDPPESSLAS